MNDSSDGRRPRRFPAHLPGGALPWALGAVCLLLAAGGERMRAFARFDRAALEAGEVWRLVTGHGVHLGWSHTLLNVGALAAVTALFADVMSRRDWAATLVLSIAAIDAGLYWLEPALDWYVGLSGVLHGLVLTGAFRLLSRQRKLALGVLAGLVAKLALEALFGASPWAAVSVEGPVVVAAHLYGTAGAAVYIAAIGVRRIS